MASRVGTMSSPVSAGCRPMTPPPPTLPFTPGEVITMIARGLLIALPWVGPFVAIWLVAVALPRYIRRRHIARLARARKAAATQSHADQLQRMADARAADGPSWRDDPATSRQMSFADELGIVYPSSITKGELSDLIEASKRRR